MRQIQHRLGPVNTAGDNRTWPMNGMAEISLCLARGRPASPTRDTNGYKG